MLKTDIKLKDLYESEELWNQYCDNLDDGVYDDTIIIEIASEIAADYYRDDYYTSYNDYLELFYN